MAREDAIDQLELYRRMLTIRRTEERLLALHSQGALVGTTHTSIGQESIPAALLGHLDEGDAVFSTHRCHGHFLAAGGDLTAFLAELMGRAGGVSGGRGGSQHLHAPGFVSSGIQGELAPVALGVAWARKLRGETGISVLFVGDGTLGQGALYETLNLASLWGIRLLVLLEHNGIAQTTPSSVAVAGDVVARAEAFAVDAARLDGSDAAALHEALGDVVESMRAGSAPAFRVVDTVRLGPHSKRDDDRTDEELASLRERDPVVLTGEALTGAQRQAVDDEVSRRLDEALAAAEASPDPDPLDHLADAYAPLRPDAAVASWSGPVQEGAEPPRVVEALNAALHDIVAADPLVHVLGEDLLDPYGGAFKVTRGLSSRFPDRVHATPISEAAIVGAGCGLALAGGKAVVEIMFGDFVALAADQLVNSAAKHHYLSRGTLPVNLVVRTPMGGGRGYGPTHSQSLEKMFLGIPGLRVVAVSSFVDPYAVLRNAVAADDGPVLLVENKLVYGERVRPPVDGRVEHFACRTGDGVYPNVRLSPGAFEDADVTVIAYGRAASIAWGAVRRIFLEHEVAADLCVVTQLSPLDLTGILEPALASRAVVTVEEGWGEASWGAEVLATLAEHGFEGRSARVAARPSPIPASKTLEDVVLPGELDVLHELERVALGHATVQT